MHGVFTKKNMAEIGCEDVKIFVSDSNNDNVSTGLCAICNCSDVNTIITLTPPPPPLAKRTRNTRGTTRLSSVENQDKDEDTLTFFEKLSRFNQELLSFGGEDNVHNRGDKGGGLECDWSKSEVCSKCKDLVNAAIESKLDMDAMEVHVRELEKTVIKALSLLDRNVQRFCKNLKNIMGVIPASKDSCGFGQQAKRSKKNNSNEKIPFQQRISSVVSKLEAYREKSSLQYSLRSFSSTQSAPVSSFTKSKLNGPGLDYGESDDHTVYVDVNMDPLDNYDDDENPMNFEDDFNDSDYTDDGVNDNTTEARRKQPKKRKAKSNSAKTDSQLPDTDLSGTQRSRSYMRVKGQLCPELEKFLVGMHPFKAAVVSRTFNKTKRKPRPGALSCPLKDHWVTYNPETDTLSVDNSIPIRINGEENALECTLCSYKCTVVGKESNRHNVERKMLFHVLGIHLKAFQCNICDTNLTSYPLYLAHMKMHTEGNPTCDECGKQVRSKLNLEVHKWTFHMTKEERKQALLEGKEHPNPKKRKPRVHQCQQCGKAFREMYELRTHVTKVHNENKVEETFICSECGKVFKKQRSLTIHQRYKCIAREQGWQWSKKRSGSNELKAEILDP